MKRLLLLAGWVASFAAGAAAAKPRSYDCRVAATEGRSLVLVCEPRPR